MISDNTQQYGSIHIVVSQNFHQSSKGNTVRPILSSQGFCFTHIVFSRIFYKFPSKACMLFLFQASFEKFESGTIRFDPYCPFQNLKEISAQPF